MSAHINFPIEGTNGYKLTSKFLKSSLAYKTIHFDEVLFFKLLLINHIYAR